MEQQLSKFQAISKVNGSELTAPPPSSVPYEKLQRDYCLASTYSDRVMSFIFETYRQRTAVPAPVNGFIPFGLAGITICASLNLPDE